MTFGRAAIGALLVTGLAFGGAALWISPPAWTTPWRGTSTGNAFVRGDVTPISPKIAGYVVEEGVRDNQAVRAGDLLFRIDDADYAARVAQAQATLDSRRAAIGNLDSRLALQQATIAQAEAVLQGAEAEQARSRRDLTRTSQLTRDGWTSQARGDQVQADTLRADAKVVEGRANLEAARQQVAVIESQRPQLKADIDAGAAALRLAQIDLDSTVIRAPADGWVGERQARIGQYVRPGTQLLAFVAQEVWVVANFKETQLPGLRVGSPVAVTVDSLPGKTFNGHVQSLSPASGAQFALLPPDNATGNFTRIAQRIPVRIALEGGQAKLDMLRPGMSAIVSAEAHGQQVAGRNVPERTAAR